MQLPVQLQPFFSWSYWFAATPPPFEGNIYYMVAGAAAFGFILGIVLRIISGRFKDASTRIIFRRLGNCFITLGVLTAINLAFTQTSTPTLGSRFWFALWKIVGLVWVGFIIKYALMKAPKERAARAKQAELNKYLPR